MHAAAHAARTARAYLEMVGLQGFAERYPRELSGEMQQLASLAYALATQPQVLLCDEPAVALDAQTRECMQAELQCIWPDRLPTLSSSIASGRLLVSMGGIGLWEHYVISEYFADCGFLGRHRWRLVARRSKKGSR